ncbi:MAG: NH(3)-dependent NAD(+) synthetase [Candidatus Poribacteria bacterium]|nr:MAG: NH(3)-dependent NAD(+) synthetase [Candidatus Poribacteria bacterium]
MSQSTEKNPLLLNPEIVLPLLTGFIRDEVTKVGFSRVVVNLSGGIDSAVSTFLAARALGPENVCALLLPYKTSSPDSLADAQAVVQQLGIRSMTISITEQVDAYFAKFPEMDRLRRANKMARERMTILYDQSLAQNALPLGTSNKTELLLGYGTIHGDLASALNPIGDLYKTQVRQLGRILGVPASILHKPPSADLWPGQTDEQELGFTYEKVDLLLYYLVDKRYEEPELIEMGFDPAFIAEVSRRVQMSQYKRRLPLIAKVSTRTITSDFRYARDWGR